MNLKKSEEENKSTITIGKEKSLPISQRRLSVV